MTELAVENTLPKDWETIRFRYVADTTKGKLPEKSEEEPSPNLGGVPYLSMEYLRGESEPTEFVFPDSMITADAGDVLLLWDGSNAGEFLQAKFGAVSSTAALLLPIKFQGRYLYWLCKGIEPILKTFTNGMGIPHVDGEFLKNLRLPFPTNKNFQQAIADYLDRETAHIDALIAEKERMLVLLEEKRATLISQAVTRGLDLDVPLKPSGLDWLGDIPAHWEVVPIKYLARVGNGSTPSVDNDAYWDEKGFPWLNSAVVNDEYVGEAPRRVSERALIECHLPQIEPPALLVGITGQGKTRGMSAILNYRATVNQHIAYISPNLDTLDVIFLSFVMGRAYSFLRSDSDGAGSTKGAITCEQLGSFRIPVPPLVEQKDIVKVVNDVQKKYRNLEEELKGSILLLKERRSALITAAVTGQIPPEEMAA